MHEKTLTTHVAGDFYKAVAAAVPGQTVRFVREPDNTADANAIVVGAADGRQLGYLPRQIAVEYAELVDHGVVRLLGRLTAPGEPGPDPRRAEINPPLCVWVDVDEARLSEVLAQAV